MFDIRQLFTRGFQLRGWPLAASDDDRPVTPPEGLEGEYQGLIATQFRRLGISEDCNTIEVRRIGKGAHGFDVLLGMVRLHRWDRTSALRLLIGLPLIESRVRKLVRSTWLADYSHFGGLWLHTSEQLHGDPGMEEIRELLSTLTPASASRDLDTCAHFFAESGPALGIHQGAEWRANSPSCG